MAIRFRPLMIQVGLHHARRLEETFPWGAFHSWVAAASDIDLVALPLVFLPWRESHRLACWGILLLVVLQDAPQRARRVMTTLRGLRGEAQHVVEEHSVDDSMDEEEAYEKDVEMDEEVGTYKGADPLLFRTRHWADAVLG